MDALGKNADEVAAALRGHGIRGVPNAVRFMNPIVRYAQGRVGGNPSGVLIGDTLTLTFPDGRVEQKPIPPAVREFLDSFNQGSYPDLVLPPDMG